MHEDNLTKCLKEGLYKAGTISVHSWVRVDIVRS